MSAEEISTELPLNEDALLGTLVGGRYRIVGVIGEGGMGKVYDGVHEGLGRPVAIKVLGAAWASDDATIRRFQREARTASSVGHRAIVDVYDLGRLDDGRPYLIMERLDGASFADLLDVHGFLPPDRVAHLVLQVASALDAVHAHGIVHRDIKPENLIALDDPEGGPEQVKLLDFGLAAFAIPSPEAARLTRHGQMHGTPHYMAPESGEESLPDYRADVYSLAVVAFELLTGFVPFDSKNPLQILTRKMHEEPPTLLDRGGMEFSDEVERVIGKGLARLPDHRYTSAGELARALAVSIRRLPPGRVVVTGTRPRLEADAEAHATGEHTRPLPLVSTRPPPPERLEVPGRASRRRRSAAAAVVVALVGGVTGLYVFASEPEPQPLLTRESSIPELDRSPAAVAQTENEATDREATDHGATGPEATDHEAADHGPSPAELGAAALVAPAAAVREEKAAHLEEQLSPPRRSARAPAARTRRPEGPPKTQPAAPSPPTPAPTARAAPAAAASAKLRPNEPAPTLAPVDRERSKQLTQQGTTALVQGRIPEAIGLFREATLVFPNNATAWRGLGLANERLGRRPEAAEAYRRYLRLAPRAGDADSVHGRIASLEGGS
jgi:eukaryotic-like serine/threonine-protein kinase